MDNTTQVIILGIVFVGVAVALYLYAQANTYR